MSEEGEELGTAAALERALLRSLAFAIAEALNAIDLERLATEIAAMLDGHRKLTPAAARELEREAEAAHVAKFGPR